MNLAVVALAQLLVLNQNFSVVIEYTSLSGDSQCWHHAGTGRCPILSLPRRAHLQWDVCQTKVIASRGCLRDELLPAWDSRKGRAIVVAVPSTPLAGSSHIPTAVPRVRAQVKLCEVYGGISATGQHTFECFCFPLSILIPPTTPYSLTVLSLTLHSRP
jgi:hypothetical protein